MLLKYLNSLSNPNLESSHADVFDRNLPACSTFIAQVQGGGQNNNYRQGRGDNNYLHFTSDSSAASKFVLLSNGNVQDNGDNIWNQDNTGLFAIYLHTPDVVSGSGYQPINCNLSPSESGPLTCSTNNGNNKFYYCGSRLPDEAAFGNGNGAGDCDLFAVQAMASCWLPSFVVYRWHSTEGDAIGGTIHVNNLLRG
jgi:hypothetical protein